MPYQGITTLPFYWMRRSAYRPSRPPNSSCALAALQLSPLTPNDLEDLLDFELVNRSFFEAHINARPSSYYSRDGVLSAIEAAIADAASDTAYQYLVRDYANVLIGRVNLTRIRRDHFHSAELGYRVAERETGKGYASEAVRQASAIAFGIHKLSRVEAIARAENAGSVAVLRRNGFVQFGRSSKSFQLAGVWYDHLHFEKHADV